MVENKTYFVVRYGHIAPQIGPKKEMGRII